MPGDFDYVVGGDLDRRERLERGPGGFPVAKLIVFAREGFPPARAHECAAMRGFLMRHRVGWRNAQRGRSLIR